MPLESEHKIDSHLVTDSVSPLKDIDGWANEIYIYLPFFTKLILTQMPKNFFLTLDMSVNDHVEPFFFQITGLICFDFNLFLNI